MRLKRATIIAHDKNTLIKVNPLRVDHLVVHEQECTRINFWLDQTMDVTGRLDAVEKVLD